MREVVILCGPPGAGKTTAARLSGLPIYDRDDPQWSSEHQFTEAMSRLADDPKAKAVVIRSGASSSARAKAARMVNATHIFVMTAERSELIRRITHRDRSDKVRTIAGVDTWFARFDQDDAVSRFPGWDAVREPDLGVVSQEW